MNTSKASLLLAFFLFILFFTSSGQQAVISVANKPLNEVLIDFAGKYGLQISFDDRELSRFRVSLDKTFTNPEEALKQLLQGLPLGWEKNGEVYIIYPAPDKKKTQTYTISGQVLEKGSLESLPYSHVLINQNGVVTDLRGSFTYLASIDSVYNIKVSHLGYYILDTMITGQADLKFYLTPSVIKLPELEISYSLVERSTLIGDEAGKMKLNHQVANFLPGFGDNSIFNLLRLQPGILAAGEQTNDVIIWGGYEGHSMVVFDGYTIYGLKNFNDNISSFNPLMAKDIEVYKGGYDARFGERVSGIVNITGKNGNILRPAFSVNINNMTMNGQVEIPIAHKGSLIIALRHTYYELYNPADVNSMLRRNNDKNTNNDVDVNIIPDYRFRDLNLKYSTRFRDRDLFYISLYGGNDRFSYSFDEPVNNNIITKNTKEVNSQGGGAIFYGKSWRNGYSTHFSFSFSSLKSEYYDNLSVEKIKLQTTEEHRDLDARNIVRESTLQVDNRFPVHSHHTLEGGLIFKSNHIELVEDTFNIVQASIADTARRIILYFQDRIMIGKKITFKPGLRLTHALNLTKLFPEPRISLSVQATGSLKFNFAWGIYHQFITKSSVLDELGNYRYIWTVCDNAAIPVLKSIHYVAGVTFNKNDFTASVEGYFKPVEGLTRYIRNAGLGLEGIYEGKGRSYGLDIMLKKDYRGHSAWISYSLSKTEELFEYFIKEEYRRAPHDQRHEVKLAALVNLDPFYISADYVYGSGFPTSPAILADEEDNLRYSRLDASFIWKFLDRKVDGEIGLSVLNVLNTQNIKLANYERIATSQSNSVNIYSEAIPITPALYFKLEM